eukprot:UN0085
MDCGQASAYFRDAMEGEGSERFVCNGDSMSHSNKGVVAMRLGFQEMVSITNVTISDLSNMGVPNGAPYCVIEGYKGTDVRGISFAHMADMTDLGVQMQKGSFTSTNMTNVIPVSGFLQMRADDVRVKSDPSSAASN